MLVFSEIIDFYNINIQNQMVSLFRPTRLILIIIISILPWYSYTQSTIFQYLASLEEPELTISVDLDSLKVSKDEYLEAILQVKAGDNVNEYWDIEVKPRGRFRRKTCTIPPLQLNFSKKDLRKRGFAEFDKIKLVLPCSEGLEGHADVAEEALVYHLYSMLTEESFRIKQLRLRLINNMDPGEIHELPAFILEPNDEIAHRLGGTDVELFNPPADSLSVFNYTRVALFEFMVGNFDWDTEMTRNVRYIRLNHSKLLHLIPYDFDFSSLVAASYAAAESGLGIKSSYDRVYLGRFFFEDLESTIELYFDKEAEILKFVSDYELLSRERRNEIQSFLRDFFKFIDKSPDKLRFRYVLSK